MALGFDLMEQLVQAIYISRKAGEPMSLRHEVQALKGAGLKGDRYSSGRGSFNKGKKGKRQVTFMNAQFFKNSGFEFYDSRRNIFVSGVELMRLIGRVFTVGKAKFRGVKYCYPCNRPSNLSRKSISFKEAFFDRGGLIAEVIKSGKIKIFDTVSTPFDT